MANRSKGKRNPDFEVPLLKQDEIPQFVVYARKSTDEGSGKQAASIPQKLEKCMEYCQKEEIRLAPRPGNQKMDQKTLEEIENDNKANNDRATRIKAFYVESWVITERGSARTPFKRN